MPFCTMCGAELAPEAKFCSSCGTAVQQVQPQQVAPQQPQYQETQPQQAMPQQPQYQEAQPQQPQYQQAAPQQNQYQQAAPQQPQYQQAAPQQTASKQKIDYLPNAANDKTTRFMWAGVIAALLGVALLFIGKTSGYHLNSIWYGLSIASTGMTCIAMVSIFLSLRKGLAGQPVAMPQLLNATAILNMVTSGITILVTVMVLLESSSIYKLIRTLSDLYSIASLAYLVCFVIVAIKLLGAYEGNMKTMAIVMLVVPGISLLMVLLELGSRRQSEAITVLFTIGVQGASCYLYYLAHQIFTGKKLF